MTVLKAQRRGHHSEAFRGFTAEPLRPRGAMPPECRCGQLVVHGRTTDGADVVLDAGRDGKPRIYARGGTFVEVSSTADVTGRRALLVQPSVEQGQYKRHRCPAPESASS